MTYSNAGGSAVATDPAFVIGITDPTGNVGVTFTGSGTSSQYIDGTGSLQTFPTIDNTTYDLTTTAGAADFANINLVPSTGSTDVVQLEAGNNMSLTVDATTGIITLEAAASTGLTSWDLQADTPVGFTQTVNNTNNLVEILGGALLTSKLSTTNSLEIGHDAISTSASTAGSSPGHGSSVALVSALTMDGFGHVTDIETDTVTWPAAGGQVNSVGFTYTTPGPQTGVAGDPAYVATVGGTATDPVLDLTAQGKGASMYIDGSGLLQDFPSIPTQWSGWIADADINTSPAWTINNATTLKFVGEVTTGGAGIVTDTIPNTELQIGLINNGGTPNATTFYRGDGHWAVPAAANTYDITGGTVSTVNPSSTLQLEENGISITTLKLIGTGGTTVAWDTGTKTYTIDSSTGSATNFDVQGSTGTTVNITQNDTLSLLAGTGISTVSNSAGDSVTISNTGVTSIIAGTGISVSPTGGTGAVTVSTSATKVSGIYVGRNFFINGKVLQGYLGNVNITNQDFIYHPVLWDISGGGQPSSSYTAPVDDMTTPRSLSTAVTGLESQINAAVFTTPYATGWSGALQAMKVTMSGTFNGTGLTSVDLTLYKGEQCSIGTIGNLKQVTKCSIPALSFLSFRTAVCCYADLSTIPAADLVISEKESYFIEIRYVGTYIWGTGGAQYFPYLAGRVDLHISA